MGNDTKLHVNSKWEISDIITVLENNLDLLDLKEKIKVIGNRTRTVKKKVLCRNEVDIQVLTFHQNGHAHARSMYVLRSDDLPTGPTLLLSLGANEEAHNVMLTIADIIGGLYMANDGDGKMTNIGGRLDEGNGLSFFLKSATIKNSLADINDIAGLGEFIKDWHKKYPR